MEVPFDSAESKTFLNNLPAELVQVNCVCRDQSKRKETVRFWLKTWSAVIENYIQEQNW